MVIMRLTLRPNQLFDRIPQNDGQYASRSQPVESDRVGSQGQVRSLMISRLVRAGVLASVAFAAMPTPASAQRMFDGNWSVLIVTERGTCDRAYRYGISIRSGQVIYEGGVVNFTGRVAPNGAVNVRVTSGSAAAAGSGRLSRNAGQGKWSGQSSGNRCSGYWTAERR
jgi:hypothetical protein